VIEGEEDGMQTPIRTCLRIQHKGTHIQIESAFILLNKQSDNINRSDLSVSKFIIAQLLKVKTNNFYYYCCKLRSLIIT
jgi:hypothetical protein